MLGNDRMETASTEATSIQRLNDIEKSTWKTHRYFVDFESRIHVDISTSNRCHNFHMDSPLKIDLFIYLFIYLFTYLFIYVYTGYNLAVKDNILYMQ